MIDQHSFQKKAEVRSVMPRASARHIQPWTEAEFCLNPMPLYLDIRKLGETRSA
jgi:hypothetical protein